MTARDAAKVLGVLAVALAIIALLCALAGLLGAFTLSGALTLLEAGNPRLAFIFNGIPWLFGFVCLIAWIGNKLKQQSNPYWLDDKEGT